MNTKTFKRTLLVILLVVLVYIWWGNIKLFRSNSAPTEEYFTERPTHAVAGKKLASISYLPPKSNPFWRPVAKAPGTMTKAPAPQPPPIPPVHQTYRVKGILRQKGQSQAILMAPPSLTRIMEVGDTLGPWRVETIGDSVVTFVMGKRRDTLRLGYHK
jgi:hypothetical protein